MDPKLCFVLCVLIITFTDAEMDRESRLLLRQNYGVILENIGIMDTPQSRWNQLFVITLNSEQLPDINHPCDSHTHRSKRSRQVLSLEIVNNNYTKITENDSSNLEHEINLQSFCPALLAYKARHDHLAELIADRQKIIDHLLPMPDRQKRGLFDFIGKVSKSLFGTATDEDVDVIKDQIQTVLREQKEATDQVHFVKNSLQSYMLKQNQHSELLSTAIKLNHDSINAFAKAERAALDSTTETLIDWVNILHSFGNHYTSVLNDILYDIDSTMAGIETLLRGYLPIQFVPPELLEKTLTNIAEEVSTYGKFSLVHHDVGFYYHLRDITFTRLGNSLYIKIRVPLTVLSNTFDIFQIHSVPIPLAPGRSDFTKLICDKPYFAISQDELYYVVMSQMEYDFCKGDEFKMCEEIYQLQNINKPHCAVGLYFGNSTMISEFCDNHYILSDKRQTHIISINASSYLVSTSDLTWTKTCSGNNPISMKACQFCIVNLPCWCSVKSESFYLPPSVSQCDNETDNVVIGHSVNLAALYKFYSKSKVLANISSHKTFILPVSAEIPEINVINKNFDRVVEKEADVQLSLHKVADNVENHKFLYQDKASYLFDNLGLLRVKFVSHSVIIVGTISFIVSMVALFLAIKNYFRVLILLGKVEAYDNLLLTQAPEVPYTVEFNSGTLTILTICILFFCLIFGIVIIVGCIIWFRRHRSKIDTDTQTFPFHTDIGIIFYGEGKIAYFHLMTTFLNVADLVVREGYPFRLPRLEAKIFGFFPKLIFSWKSLSMVVKSSDRDVNLPLTLNLSSNEYNKLRDIMNNLNTFRIVGKQNGNFFDLYTYENQDMRNHAELKPLMPVSMHESRILSQENLNL